MIIKLDNRYYGTIFFYTILLFLIVLGVTMILKSNFDIRTIIGFSFSIVLTLLLYLYKLRTNNFKTGLLTDKYLIIYLKEKEIKIHYSEISNIEHTINNKFSLKKGLLEVYIIHLKCRYQFGKKLFIEYASKENIEHVEILYLKEQLKKFTNNN